jgi:plastocyanin
MLLGVAALALPALASADNDGNRERRVITVAFGAGLNTAQPGNEENHHVIPETIRISAGDVVSFNVAGLHVIRVYGNGVRLRDVKLNVPGECQVNPPQAACDGLGGTVVPTVPTGDLAVYYQGLNPIPLVAPPETPPPELPPFVAPSTAVNRIEPVVFTEPGRYLVICAVLEHFNDGMIAWVEVRPNIPNNGGSNNGGHGNRGGHGPVDD